jgi:8-oxo-dGTP diphosphatase
MVKLTAGDGEGSALLAFERFPEDDLDCLDASVPLTASLVVLWSAHRCLMVFNRRRRVWELPGGMLDPGESPRQAAVRELEEESGQRPDTVDFAAAARTWFAPAQRIEYVALYQGRIACPVPFVPNEEMSHSRWWSPGEDLPDLNPIDAALALLSPAGSEWAEGP